MSSQVISADNATVFIQINAQVVEDSTEREEKQGPYNNEVLKAFLKGQPKALGTVQIIIGVVIFFIGIMLGDYRRHYFDIVVDSGITYWGSIIYITAGSLSVSAENKLRSCVVKALLVMNGFSARTSLLATVMSLVQLSFWSVHGIVLVFSILQCIISICISFFAYKVTYDTKVASFPLNQSRVSEEAISPLNEP